MSSSVNENKSIQLDQIHQVYKELFPDDLEFLVLYSLHISFASNEIQYSEIKYAITQTTNLPFLFNGRERQVERIFKKLLGIYIERIPGKFNQFTLTPHAERILQIVIHRINNPYLRFPLKETFETYFSLPLTASENISDLQRWFKMGFENNAQQVVTSHIEGLKISVDSAIKELNKVLEADDLSALEMLEKFAVSFKILGDKARQIGDAISMKVDVYYELKNICDAYSKRASQFQSLLSSEEIEQNRIAELNRETSDQIKEEVYIFFDKVDKQLDLINSKMTFASYKIAELHDSLKAQSHYKINLKKLLLLCLENSTIDRQNNIILPTIFVPKGVLNEKFRFASLRYWNLGFLKKGIPVNQEEDDVYERNERERFEFELAKQELVQKLCDRAMVDLSTSKRLELDTRFFEIIDEHESVEVAVQTIYDLIRNMTTEDSLIIKEELQTNNTKDISIWKTSIQRTQDLSS